MSRLIEISVTLTFILLVKFLIPDCFINVAYAEDNYKKLNISYDETAKYIVDNITKYYSKYQTYTSGRILDSCMNNSKFTSITINKCELTILAEGDIIKQLWCGDVERNYYGYNHVTTSYKVPLSNIIAIKLDGSVSLLSSFDKKIRDITINDKIMVNTLELGINSKIIPRLANAFKHIQIICKERFVEGDDPFNY